MASYASKVMRMAAIAAATALALSACNKGTDATQGAKDGKADLGAPVSENHAGYGNNPSNGVFESLKEAGFFEDGAKEFARDLFEGDTSFCRMVKDTIEKLIDGIVPETKKKEEISHWQNALKAKTENSVWRVGKTEEREGVTHFELVKE